MLTVSDSECKESKSEFWRCKYRPLTPLPKNKKQKNQNKKKKKKKKKQQQKTNKQFTTIESYQ